MALFTTILSSKMILDRRFAQRRAEEAARERIAALRAAHAAQGAGMQVPEAPPAPELHAVEVLRRAGKVSHR